MLRTRIAKWRMFWTVHILMDGRQIDATQHKTWPLALQGAFNDLKHYASLNPTWIRKHL